MNISDDFATCLWYHQTFRLSDILDVSVKRPAEGGIGTTMVFLVEDENVTSGRQTIEGKGFVPSL